MAASSAIIISLVALVLLLFKTRFLSGLYRYLRCFYYLRKLPVPTPPRWFVGHSFDARPENFINRIMTTYSKWSKEELASSPGVSRADLSVFIPMAIVDTPDAVRTILKTSEPKNSYIYSFLVPWIGEGLLISNGKKWARNRRLLTPAFHFGVLTGYVNVYKSAVGTLVQKWSTMLLQSGAESCRVPVSQDVCLLTLDVILQCAMTCRSNCQTEPNDYTNTVMTLIMSSQFRGLDVLQHPDFIYHRTKSGCVWLEGCDSVHAYSERIINERRAEMERGEGHSDRPVDFLDILLTAEDTDGTHLSDIDIRNEVDTFLFEGHDTTASALQWSLYFIAGHTDVQERCREEARDVLCEDGTSTPEVTYDKLQELTYIGQAVKEAMRLASTVPLIYRRLTKDVEVGGYLLPDGAFVVVNLWSLHHNPGIWDNPMQYDPSRFDPGAASDARPVYSYVPFSGGPRNCIGQSLAMEEMKAAVALLLLKFELSVPADMADMKQMVFAVLRPEHPIELTVRSVESQ